MTTLNPQSSILNPERPVRGKSFKGLGRIIGFFAFLFVLAIVLDSMISTGLRRIKTSSIGAFNQVMLGQVNADIIITGSSRAQVHYDPRIIAEATGKTAFNLGLNGSQTDMQLAYFKAYLERNRKPEMVIHNLDLFTFSMTKEVYDPARYFGHLASHPIYEELRRINPDAWKWKYMPLYKYSVEDMRFTWMNGLKGFFGWNPPEDHFLGYNPRDLKWTGDFESFKANQSSIDVEIEPAGIEVLRSLIQVCHERKITLILVYTPEYYEAQEMTSNRAKIFETFQNLAAPFQVPIWDYSGSPLCQQRDLFYNSQHLNRPGSGAFSQDLARRIKSFNPSHPD